LGGKVVSPQSRQRVVVRRPSLSASQNGLVASLIRGG
jgi:hypothetical protein